MTRIIHNTALSCVMPLRETSVQLHAYALMPDHVHLLFSTANEQTASKVMQQVGRRYVRYYNDRHERAGTLWEGRYRSTVIEPAQFLIPCYRYIELNACRAGLASDPSNLSVVPVADTTLV